MIKIGDYVTRSKYNHDIIFRVIDIKDKKVILKGKDVRLIADSEQSDLSIVEKSKTICNDSRFENEIKKKTLDRNNYFYIPGKILHLDGDEDYLNRCKELYKKANVPYVGLSMKETEMKNNVKGLIVKHRPNIIVITGHDAFYKQKNEYKNSDSFIETVKNARTIEKYSENLSIIAGACQSNYEGLIQAGATYASSPKRINIHALDPSIVAISLSMEERESIVDVEEVLNKTEYGPDGIGGLKTKGMMYVGYPRKV